MKLHSETLDLSTRQPFGIARWTHSHYSRTFVSLEHEGLTGHGEAAPNAYYGETSGTVQAVLPELAMAVQDPWDWEGLSARMSSVLPHWHPSVRCALEMASLDWCARRVDLPVWRLLGLSDTCVPESSFTISLAPLDDMRSQTTEALNAGYTILKVKLGTDRDVAILEALREEAPSCRLRVDANAAWSRTQARWMLPVLAAHDVELLEQPPVAGDLEGHAELRRRSPLPLVADESLTGLTVLPTLAGAFDAVNLKLAKLGGPLQALRAVALARTLGMNVMMGCMVESSLGISAAAQLSGLVDWVDLDGALLLAADPFQGLEWQGGQLARPTRPGWGVDRS